MYATSVVPVASTVLNQQYLVDPSPYQQQQQLRPPTGAYNTDVAYPVATSGYGFVDASRSLQTPRTILLGSGGGLVSPPTNNWVTAGTSVVVPPAAVGPNGAIPVQSTNATIEYRAFQQQPQLQQQQQQQQMLSSSYVTNPPAVAATVQQVDNKGFSTTGDWQSQGQTTTWKQVQSVSSATVPVQSVYAQCATKSAVSRSANEDCASIDFTTNNDDDEPKRPVVNATLNSRQGQGQFVATARVDDAECRQREPAVGNKGSGDREADVGTARVMVYEKTCKSDPCSQSHTPLPSCVSVPDRDVDPEPRCARTAVVKSPDCDLERLSNSELRSRQLLDAPSASVKSGSSFTDDVLFSSGRAITSSNADRMFGVVEYRREEFVVTSTATNESSQVVPENTDSSSGSSAMFWPGLARPSTQPFAAQHNPAMPSGTSVVRPQNVANRGFDVTKTAEYRHPAAVIQYDDDEEFEKQLPVTTWKPTSFEPSTEQASLYQKQLEQAMSGLGGLQRPTVPQHAALSSRPGAVDYGTVAHQGPASGVPVEPRSLWTSDAAPRHPQIVTHQTRPTSSRNYNDSFTPQPVARNLRDVIKSAAVSDDKHSIGDAFRFLDDFED